MGRLALLLVFCDGCSGTSGEDCASFTFPATSVSTTCDAPFSVFEGHAFFPSSVSLSDLQSVDFCVAVITDEDGRQLGRYPLEAVLSTLPDGTTQVSGGCVGGGTPREIGVFLYVTRRTSGNLTFRVDGMDSAAHVVETGSAQASARIYPPATQVEIALVQL